MSYVSNPDDFDTLVDHANGADYENIPVKLKKEIKDHVDEATAMADNVTKQTVEMAASDTFKAMDGVADAERFYAPSPTTWKDFKRREVSHIHETLNDLSYLINKNVNEVKENITDAIVEKTGSVVKSFRDATEVLTAQKEVIKEETMDMHDTLKNINQNVRALDALLLKSDNEEIRKLVTSIKADSQDAIDSFSHIYTHQANRALQPERCKEVLLEAKDTMKSYAEVLNTYVDMSKAFVKNKADNMVKSVVTKVSDAAKKTRTFMSSLKNKLSRGIEKGKKAFDTVNNFRMAIVITSYDKRDAEQQNTLDGVANMLMTPVSKHFVEKMAKSGLDNANAQKAIDFAVDSFKNTLTEIASKDKYQKMFKENSAAVAR